MANVSDYPNGQAPRSALVLFEGVWVSPDMAARLGYAFPRIRARGATISLTEGYRWLGAPSDRAIGRRGGRASETSDGTSNQFYQKGREDGGFTPSAATPGGSNHGKGNSVDTDCSSISIRDEEFEKVGLRRDIASETWHATIYKAPSVTLAAVSSGTAVTTKGDDMTQTVLVTAPNNAKHYFTISDERITHNGSENSAVIASRLNSSSDEIHKIDAGQFWEYVDAMGIPRGVIDLDGGKVLNVDSGSGEKGATWSRNREGVEKLERIRRKLGA